jgi:lipopolysaccharide biosynthesis glycosyltransferase
MPCRGLCAAPPLSCLVTAETDVVVASAADGAYAMPLAAMLHSAFVGLRPGGTITAHIIDAGLSTTDRGRLDDIARSHRAALHWHEPSPTALDALQAWGRMTSTTYHRLLLPQLLPRDVTRAIWLDCDLLVTTDLVRLWETDLGGCHLLAVRDPVVPLVSSRYGIRRWRELGISRDAPYFNAGVMLLDVDRWRNDDIGGVAGDYLRQAPDVMFWDQEGLNAVLPGRWRELDSRWNRMASAMRRSDTEEAHAAAWIVHFSGALKPWRLPEPRSGPCLLFYRHLDQTPWEGWRPRPTPASKALGWYESSRFRDLLYPVEPWVMLSARRRLSRLTAQRDRRPVST